MKENEQLIQDQATRIRETFGNEAKLYEYLFETMENFFYRYLETAESKNLKVSEMAKLTFGAQSFESSMVDALKIKNPAAHLGILELAKRVPKAQKPLVKYTLLVTIKEFTSDHGDLVVTTKIDWGFPEFTDESKSVRKDVTFKYDELGVFRKALALKLEEACELFS